MKKKRPKTVKAWVFMWTAGNSFGFEIETNRKHLAEAHKEYRKEYPFRVGAIVRIEVPAPKEKPGAIRR